MLTKEALHNIVKHARASEARLGIKLAGSTLTLTIEDNGQGFPNDVLLAAQTGSGMKNMERRIADLRGQLNITSELGSGTQIRVAVPLGDSASPP